MPGICGIFGQPDARERLHGMITKIDHFNYTIEQYHSDEFSIGRVYLGFVNTGPQPVFSADRRYCIVMIGEIFSYDSIEIPEKGGDAHFLLDKFVKTGTKCFSRINGQFTAAICDISNRKIILVSDRYGTRPLYYSTVEKGLAFAPEVKALIKPGTTPEINYGAVSELLHLGFVYGSHTLFRDYHQLPPASYLEFGENQYTITRYWDFPYEDSVYHDKKITRKQIDQYLEELPVVFKNAVKRQSRFNTDKLLLPLSGGLDSRWVAALLNDIGIKRVTTFTIGEQNTDDVIYAKMVADHLNYDHTVFSIKPSDVWMHAELFGYISDGMSEISGPIQMTEPLKTFINKTEILLAPQVCDALFGSTLYRPSVAFLVGKRSYDTAVNQNFLSAFCRIHSRDVMRIFNKPFSEKINDNYQTTIDEYIKKYHDPLHAYFCLFMEQYGRRGTFGGNLLYNLFFDTRMPSYDNDLIELGFNVPIVLRKGQYIYRMAFAHKFPELSRIPRDKTGLPIDISNRRVYLKQVQNVLLKRFKKTSLNLIIKKVKRWNRPNYVDYDKWFKMELRDLLETLLLDKRTLERGIFDRNGLESLIHEHVFSRKDHSLLLWQLVNLEYTHRNFID